MNNLILLNQLKASVEARQYKRIGNGHIFNSDEVFNQYQEIIDDIKELIRRVENE